MNDRRLRRVRDELATLVRERRAERERNALCPACGKSLAEPIRIVEPGEGACEVCEAKAKPTGAQIVMMWPPRGIDEDGPDTGA